MSWGHQNPLSSQLTGDEQVLWCGRPRPGAYTFRNWMFSAVGVFWLVLCLLWLLTVRGAGLPPALYLVAIPLLALFMWMTVGHIIWAAIESGNVHYVITDWRVLMSYGWPRAKVRTVPLARIAELDLWPRRNGYGDIRLGLEVGYWDGARWAKAGAVTPGHHDMVLRGIPASTQVYAQLCEAIRVSEARGQV